MTARESVLLDTVSAEVAVLDGSGTTVSVNEAWNRFSFDNGGEPERTEEVGAVVTLSPVHKREASMHEELTQELLAVGAGLQRLLTLHAEPARAALDPTLVEDVRDVVSRLWNALLGPTKNQPQESARDQ